MGLTSAACRSMILVKSGTFLEHRSEWARYDKEDGPFGWPIVIQLLQEETHSDSASASK